LSQREKGKTVILRNLPTVTLNQDPPKDLCQNLHSISKCYSIFLILLKSTEVPLFSFIYHCPFVGCAVHDDAGQPLISHSKGNLVEQEAASFHFSEVLTGFG